MCVYGSLWAFADTRVGAPVLEAAHHPDFFLFLSLLLLFQVVLCEATNFDFVLFHRWLFARVFLIPQEPGRPKRVDGENNQSEPAWKPRKKICVCLSVFFLRPAVSLITDHFTPAAHVSRLVLFPSHVDQHFLWHSPLSQQRKAVSWWMVKSY